MAIVRKADYPTRPSTTNKTAKDICASLLNRHDERRELCIKEAELGFDGRVDFMAMRYGDKYLGPTVYEIKISRSDFKGDKKWPKYLKYCERFYFACPDGLIKTKELGPGIGLMWVYKNGRTEIVKKSKVRKHISGPERYRILHRLLRKYMFPNNGALVHPGETEPLLQYRDEIIKLNVLGSETREDPAD